MFVKLSWQEELFLVVLPKVGPSLSLRHLILMTLEGSFDHLMRFARRYCAVAIANSLLLQHVEAFIGTRRDAFTLHRDASHLGKCETALANFESMNVFYSSDGTGVFFNLAVPFMVKFRCEHDKLHCRGWT